MTLQWKPTPEDLMLSADYVDIWKCCVATAEDQLNELFSLLSDEEKSRAKRLKITEKQNQFIVTRGRLRQILGRYLNSDPCAFRFKYATHGKPYLANRWQGHELSFNVTHSHDCILIALTMDQQVGIDIEKIQIDRDHKALAKRFFSKRELADLTALPDEIKTSAFYSCWTRKEAFVKAVGDGITYGLDTFDVSIHPDESHPSLDLHKHNPGDKSWTILDLPVGEDYMAAIAVSCDTVNIRCWQMSD